MRDERWKPAGCGQSECARRAVAILEIAESLAGRANRALVKTLSQVNRLLQLRGDRRLWKATTPDTPVGCVRNASRPGETATISTLGGLDPELVDMLTVVIVGSSRSRAVAGRFVTPRGYRWLSS